MAISWRLLYSKCVNKLSANPRLLHAIDSILCLVVFYPSMVFYWRGIWDLYGVYISPDDPFVCNWAVFGLGCGAILGYFIHLLINRVLRDVTNRVVYFVVSRVYMYAFAVLLMAYWRGGWTVADYYLAKYEWKSALVGLLTCYPLLLVLGSSRGCLFPPFAVCLDTRGSLLVPSTRCQTEVVWTNAKSVVKYTMDSVFTHFVLLSLTVVSWRSGISLLDYILYDDDPVKSNGISFIIGITGCIVMFALEVPLAAISYRLRDRRWLKFVFDDAVFTVIYIIETFLWRGGWNLNTIFIVADPMIGGWVNHTIGTFFLMTLQLFSYAGACGCSLDYDVTAPCFADAMYNTRYLRDFLSPPSDNVASSDMKCEDAVSVRTNSTDVSDQITVSRET